MWLRLYCSQRLGKSAVRVRRRGAGSGYCAHHPFITCAFQSDKTVADLTVGRGSAPWYDASSPTVFAVARLPRAIRT